MEPQKSFELNSSDVHIWSASLLEDKNNTDYFYSILSEDERERAGSFKFSKDQWRFAITRGILRCLLSKYLGQTPESIEIMYGLWGKPCLTEEKSLQFNLSHSGDYALYAVARTYEVGVDLEYINKNLKLDDIAFCIFSADEINEWKNLDSDERANSFFTRWASKEAFLKASGKGWLEDKKEFTFNFKHELRKGNINNEVTNPYCFECIPGYASALFVDGALLRPLYYAWDHGCFDFEEA